MNNICILMNKNSKLILVPAGTAELQVQGIDLRIKDTGKLCTEVYINEAGTILYVEAIGD